jgi:hypothetical protein
MISSIKKRMGRLRSAVGQKILDDIVTIALEEHVGAAMIADLLVRPFDHAVAFAGLSIDDFAGSGDFEALFSA